MAELTGKTIAELPEDTSLSGSEFFPVMDGSSSKKVAYSTLRDESFRINGGVAIEAGTDLDTFLTPGTFFCSNVSNVTNGAPPATYTYKLVVMRTVTISGTPRIWQIVYEMRPSCVEYRRNYDSNGWSDWSKIDPTSIASRFDALESGVIGSVCSFSTFSVASNTTETISVSGKRGMLVLSGAATGLHGLYTFYHLGSGDTILVPVKEVGSQLTLTVGVGTIAIASTSSYTARGLLVTF